MEDQMSSAITLPRNVRSLPQVDRLVGQLTSSRRQASALREIAKDSVSPGRATMDIQGGALLCGAIEGVVGEAYAPMAAWAAAFAAFAAGLAMDNQDLILVANGLAAPMTAQKGFDLVTTARARTGG